MAKLIPAINNAENPTQSMNLIGEKFFITDQYIIPQPLTPCLKMDFHSKVARSLEVWGKEFFIKSLLVIQKGLKLVLCILPQVLVPQYDVISM